MSLTNPNKTVTEERLAEFYQQILPYLGGMPEVLANKFNKSDLYSTDEKIIGCWIDGRPLYQKTFVHTINRDNPWEFLFDTEIPSIGQYYNIISCAAYNPTTNPPKPVLIPGSISAIGTTNAQLSTLTPVASNRSIYITFDTTALWTAMLTLQYTKTTDQADAFNVGTNTDYSTTEKIIGTWIDEKPIYQRVIAKSLENGTSSITFSLADEIQNLGSVIAEKVMARPSNSSNIHISPVYTASLAEIRFEYSRKASKDSVTYTFTNYWTTPAEAYLVVQYTKTTD